MAIVKIKRNSLKFGILIGVIVPLIGAVVFYFVKFYPTFSFTEFFNVVLHNKPVLTAVSSISLLINVAIFTFYINSRLDKTAKGIFLITVLYILLVLVYKLF